MDNTPVQLFDFTIWLTDFKLYGSLLEMEIPRLYGSRGIFVITRPTHICFTRILCHYFLLLNLYINYVIVRYLL